MNEVMCLAEDHGLDIYYQDTDDSMHLKETSVDVWTLQLKENITELLMNAGYDTSILKPVENETRSFNNENEFHISYTCIKEL